MDQSSERMNLMPPMQVLGKFKNLEIKLNGDENNKNAGRISLYNSITIFLTSTIPFQQNCYVSIKFPPQLKLEKSELLLGKGTGFF